MQCKSSNCDLIFGNIFVAVMMPFLFKDEDYYFTMKSELIRLFCLDWVNAKNLFFCILVSI